MADIMDNGYTIQYSDQQPVWRPPFVPTEPYIINREAEEKSFALLNKHLSPSQKSELTEHSRISVISQYKRLYWIIKGHQGNVYLVSGPGHPSRCYCVVMPGVPDYDLMLAQKLLLEYNENRFLSLANSSVMLRPY